MPTENRSSNTEQMVSLPLDLVELALAHLPSDSAAGFELRELLAQPATQHQGEPERDARDYAIEHAGFLADAADQVLADYKAYSLAQMLESEGGDDGGGELEDAVDAARDDLREGLANLRGMAYEFRKRRVRSDSSANAEPAPTSNGFSAGDMADQGAKAFRDGQRALVLPKRMNEQDAVEKLLGRFGVYGRVPADIATDIYNAALDEVRSLNAAAISPE
ncbi:hypothetical protein [Pseudomonas tussilaginis]|uniref:hypothetical protein n=1 Tax=Pseudomonas putida TaxID=303 RepID=UPI0023635D5E|nr:hypothetical protein [Pseudomonas putida]MDD1976970.1 hypothetical protein [Pseudomonas putida]